MCKLRYLVETIVW